jgi:hypothetical protein
VSAKRVGILELLTTPARGVSEHAYNLVLPKQYASITPQAIAAWCRRRGDETYYAVYWGAGDPRRLLPRDLDVIFIATYTQASALAYALAKLYRRDGVRTVIGGPHAKAFPTDCLRFFDVVVGDCDEHLIANVVHGMVDPGTIVNGPAFREVPTAEERLPEIRASTLLCGRWRYASTTIPLLASTGCPYTCDFCVDWNRPYRQLPLEHLAVDLRTVAATFPGAMVSFHDANFAIKFDAVLDVLESLPRPSRPPYIMESSLSVLHGKRLPRLRDSNCAMAAPGVESWSAYGGKSGTRGLTGLAKVESLIERFAEIREHVPYVQANFLFGVDDDGGQTVALTKTFMDRTPFVWPVVNIPHPFGGTPLFAQLHREGRILTTLPFSFYYSPYLATVPMDEDPASYYAKLIDLFAYFTAPAMLLRRLRSTSSRFVRLAHVVRTRVKRRRLHAFRRLHELMIRDRAFAAFHGGRMPRLPEFYHREYERMLGPFAPLMSRADRTPVFG